MNTTIDYYDDNAETFIENTVKADLSETQDRFLSCLAAGARILDLGCGSGRDARYFLQKGFRVDATDGSEKMCRYASELTGIKVRHMMFQELSGQDIYDGIWACSSILHLTKSELETVFCKMHDVLRDKGIIYASFKNGLFAGERNGRYFTDFTIETFREFLNGTEGLVLREYWLTGDVRPERGDEKWLNLILQKK